MSDDLIPDDFANPLSFARREARGVAIRTTAFAAQYVAYHRLGWSKLQSVGAGLATAAILGIAARRWR